MPSAGSGADQGLLRVDGKTAGRISARPIRARRPRRNWRYYRLGSTADQRRAYLTMPRDPLTFPGSAEPTSALACLVTGGGRAFAQLPGCCHLRPGGGKPRSFRELWFRGRLMPLSNWRPAHRRDDFFAGMSGAATQTNVYRLNKDSTTQTGRSGFARWGTLLLVSHRGGGVLDDPFFPDAYFFLPARKIHHGH